MKVLYCGKCGKKKDDLDSVKGYCKNCKQVCVDCGKPKESVERSYCNACRSRRRREKLAKLGISYRELGRKDTCSKCGKIKESKESGHCYDCRNEKRRIDRAKKRQELGLKAWGSGSKVECSRCGKPKERQYDSYCNECYRARFRERRDRLGIPPGRAPGKGRKPECSRCGNIKENTKKPYCFACAAEDSRLYYHRKYNTPEAREKKKEHYREKWNESDLFRFKRRVHGCTKSAIERGFLIPQPCEVCGCEPVDAHHDDYTKPYDVRWLCRSCHNKHHNQSEID